MKAPSVGILDFASIPVGKIKNRRSNRINHRFLDALYYKLEQKEPGYLCELVIPPE